MFALCEALSLDEVMEELRAKGSPRAVEGMGRFGIRVDRALGVSVPALRGMAKRLGKDHLLALDLWKTGVHEARILASMVEDPGAVDEEQLEAWVSDFDSWDLCDLCCGGLFDRLPVAYEKALEWSGREEEFVKRAGFALMAALAVHDKEAPDSRFYRFLSAIEKGSVDERNFVKKAVNWALRQVGKRSATLNGRALEVASRISKRESRAARWVAADAMRELESGPVRSRLGLTSGARASPGGRYRRYRKGRSGRRPPARSSS